ncbi:NACHT domain-containing protein [Actinokineospora globicatena]|uniref:NACHT domain-containing protein n=1 Tax=Actinokineospora globicatena TaxID=103729 RepID=UPI0020A59F27|nr:NACHT domain-containing protein [Actinokineospora globicatena]MCP2305022.1 NACHT domain-containing protein [Actinokineospora globicatena]GLW80484.1 hypothetical protein Aglo01_49650 [Actinokineospora globicatena]GLW87312.1 hypothetical protein Aglo02_49510 [Actinokineospora globicatena]
MLPRTTRWLVLAVVLSAVLGVSTNVAASVLPEGWRPYLWIAWPLSAVLIAVIIVVERRRAPERSTGGDSRQARRVLLGRVRRYWVDGVLRRSLYQEARLELGLAVNELRNHPWELRSTTTGQRTRHVAAGTAMTTVFDELDRTMVVVGAPGSGKTTILLELANQLLDKAEVDPAEPAPVVLALASWSKSRVSLADWVEREIAQRYEIPAHWVRGWLADGALTLLLDGLDEVDPEHRAACVAAINAFRGEHGSTSVVVTCRVKDHAALKEPLNTYGRVEIQPLTRAQVGVFLAADSFSGVRAELARDPSLWELLDTPLNLSIAILAYRDGPASDPVGGDQATRRRRLFAAYVRTMLVHRPSPRYSPEVVLRAMVLVAALLRRLNITLLSFDLFDNSTVPRGDIIKLDRMTLLLRLLVSCVFALIAGLFLGWYSLALGAAAGYLSSAESEWTVSAWDVNYRDLRGRPYRPAPVSLQLTFSIFGTGYAELAKGIPLAVGFGIAVTASRLVDFGGQADLNWSFLAWGAGLGTAVVVMVAYFLVVKLYFVVSTTWRPRRNREVPSPGVLGMVRVAMVLALSTAALVGALGLLVLVQMGEEDVVGYTIVFVVLTFLFGLYNLAGYAVAEQWFVRRRLRAVGYLPLPAAPLLDHAVAALFLQRVGDNYLFVHRELLDFFADRVELTRFGIPPLPANTDLLPQSAT